MVSANQSIKKRRKERKKEKKKRKRKKKKTPCDPQTRKPGKPLRVPSSLTPANRACKGLCGLAQALLPNCLQNRNHTLAGCSNPLTNFPKPPTTTFLS